MKLPEDRKERTRVLALIGAGSLLAAYALFAGAVRPLAAKKAQAAQRIEQLHADLTKARGEIAQIESLRAGNRAALERILGSTDRSVLRSRLGNFLLSAQEIIQQHAKSLQVKVRGISELGITELPQPGAGGKKKGGAREPQGGETPPAKDKSGKAEKPPDHTFKLYVAKADLSCGFHALVALLEALETENPYLCVSGIQILADPNSPSEQKVSLFVSWPIWADPDAEERLRRQVEVSTNALDNIQENDT
jgi:hypothetical protein